jgi:hypothetical protein
MRRFILLGIFLAVSFSASAQKVGVLTFEDAAGVGSSFGETVAKFIRSEFLRNKKYLPKFIQYEPKAGESKTIDVEKAIEVGKQNGVDYVVIGTILEAESNQSSTGLGGISVMGQRVGSSARSVTAKITIQGDLISLKEGKLIESFRTEGNETDRSVGANVSTRWGSMDADDNSITNTPTGRALQRAVEELVKQMSDKIKK